jgi:uncharacterized protein (TIGR03435 family)
MASILMIVVGGLAAAISIGAQSAEDARPKFEVASIKPCVPETAPAQGGRSGGGGRGGDPGMFRIPCVTVLALIEGAYIRYAGGQTTPVSPLKKQPVQGGPDWIDSERFAIDARPPAPQPRAIMAGPMMQTLLEERFKLKIHRESKRIPVYALVVGKSGAKLQATPAGGCTPGDAQGLPPPIVAGQPLPCGFIDGDDDGIKAVGVPIAGLCQIISSQVHQAVIDQTGLTGLFDFHFGFNTPPPGSRSADDPDRFAAAISELRNLGLELKSTTGDAEIIVIDHIERPSQN